MKTAIQHRLSAADAKRLVRIKKDLARLSASARVIADESGLSRREIAQAMGNASPSTLQRLLAGAAYNATLDSLGRFAWACGYELRTTFVKREEVAPAETTFSATAGECVVYHLPNYAHLRAGGWRGAQANSDFVELSGAGASTPVRAARG